MTMRPDVVIKAINDYYVSYPACSGHGRSQHWWSEQVGDRTQEARETIARLIGLSPVSDEKSGEMRERDSDANSYQVVFVHNTTDALNRIARGLTFNERKNVVMTTEWEHNSNFLPWRDIADAGRIRLKHFPVDRTGATFEFDLDLFETMVRATPELKVVSIVFTSNLNGYTAPVEDIVRICRTLQDPNDPILIVLDGAQAVPYRPVKVKTPSNPGGLDIDFLAFSIHKMCGPSGGVLYARDLTQLTPMVSGGGTIAEVFIDKPTKYLQGYQQHEAGLQDYAGIIGAGQAAAFLQADDRLASIREHVVQLNEHLTSALQGFDDDKLIEIVRPAESDKRGSIFTFLASGAVSDTIEEECRKDNIMYRRGKFCVGGYFDARRTNNYTEGHRFSLYLYNTMEECEIVATTLQRALRVNKNGAT